MAKSCVISAKVTPDIAKAIKSQAKSEGKSVSAWVSDRATTTKGMALGGRVPTQQVNTIMETAMIFGGSSLVGLLTYKGVNSLLRDSRNKGEIKYTDKEIEFYSGLLGVLGAIVTGIGLNKLVNRNK